jgi:hypothetical protein
MASQPLPAASQIVLTICSKAASCTGALGGAEAAIGDTTSAPAFSAMSI